MSSASTLDQVLDRGDGRAPAIQVPDGLALTYDELRAAVASASDQLARSGLGRKDRIALVLPNSIETIVMFLAAARVGTVAPLNPAYTARALCPCQACRGRLDRRLEAGG